MTTSHSQQASASSSSSNGACGSSLPRWRLWLQTLNWRHNPDLEKQISASQLRTKQLENEIELLRSESAQIESETEQLRKESLRVRSESLRVRSETEQIENEKARLSELNSKLDAIVFSFATNSTPAKPTPSESEM